MIRGVAARLRNATYHTAAHAVWKNLEVCTGANAKTDQLRAFNVAKSKSAGDLIAELKAHSGVASLRKVGLRSTGNMPVKQRDDEGEKDGRELRLVTLRHVNTALP